MKLIKHFFGLYFFVSQLINVYGMDSSVDIRGRVAHGVQGELDKARPLLAKRPLALSLLEMADSLRNLVFITYIEESGNMVWPPSRGDKPLVIDQVKVLCKLIDILCERGLCSIIDSWHIFTECEQEIILPLSDQVQIKIDSLRESGQKVVEGNVLKFLELDDDYVTWHIKGGKRIFLHKILKLKMRELINSTVEIVDTLVMLRNQNKIDLDLIGQEIRVYVKRAKSSMTLLEDKLSEFLRRYGENIRDQTCLSYVDLGLIVKNAAVDELRKEKQGKEVWNVVGNKSKQKKNVGLLRKALEENRLDFLNYIRCAQQFKVYKAIEIYRLPREHIIEILEKSEKESLFKSHADESCKIFEGDLLREVKAILHDYVLEQDRERGSGKGARWEITSALYLFKECARLGQLTSLAKHLMKARRTDFSREFDLEILRAGNRVLLVECKNIDWKLVNVEIPSTDKVLIQLSEQLEIAQSHRHEFALLSKEEVPSAHCAWLDRKRIQYIDPRTAPTIFDGIFMRLFKSEEYHYED